MKAAALALSRHLRTIHRFGRVASFIDSNLDEALDLACLAEVAGLSRPRLDADFMDYASETPIGRLWRVRLMRAREQILVRPELPLLDVALEAGYGSAAAFSRAFRRLHGVAPSRCRGLPPAREPALRIEHLPPLETQFLPYTGVKHEQRHAAEELRARAMLRDIPRTRRFGWTVNAAPRLYATEREQVDIQTALLHAPLGERVPGLDRGVLGGGDYAVFFFAGAMRPPPPAALAARILAETGWRVEDGPWLRRCRNTQHLPSYLDSRYELYIPVRRATARARAPGAFVLER